jgi:hypothetical protein
MWFQIIKWAVVVILIAWIVYIFQTGKNQSTGDSAGPALLWLFKQLGLILIILLWIIFFRHYK